MKSDEQKPVCKHYQEISAIHKHRPSPYIKPNLKGWTCIYDACVQLKKTKQQLKAISTENADIHSVFIHMSTLQIYCVQCNIQLYDFDDSDNSVENNQRKGSKQNVSTIICNPYYWRLRAIQQSRDEEQTLFGGNVQFPQSFWKDKQGFCGLKSSSITSYLNATFHMMSHIDSIRKIFQKQIRSSQQLHRNYQKIWQGKYRILKTDQFLSLLIKNYPNLKSYEKKTPFFVLFTLFKIIMNELGYDDVKCSSKEIHDFYYDETDLKIKNRFQFSLDRQKEVYSPLKQIFGGQFYRQDSCIQCSYNHISSHPFQCLCLAKIKQNFFSKSSMTLEKLIDLACSNYQSSLLVQKKQKCACGGKLQIKCYMKIPNVIVFEIENDHDGFMLELPDKINLGKYTHLVTNSQLKDYDYQYVGSIGKQNKKYYYHGVMNGKFYYFRDSIIKEQLSKPKYVKMAVYKVSMTQKRALARNVESSIQLGIEPIVPLPDFLLVYLAQLKFIRPLANPLICKHGLIKPQSLSKCTQVNMVPTQIYQFLLQQFGGRKPDFKQLKRLYALKQKGQIQQIQCRKCQQHLAKNFQIKQIEKQLAKIADRFSNKKQRALVYLQWFNNWKKYLYEKCQKPYNIFGFPRPKAIPNHLGLEGKQIKDEKLYKKVSPQVWYFLKKVYGGSPLIFLGSNKYRPNYAVVQCVDLKLKQLSKIMGDNKIIDNKQIEQAELEQSIIQQDAK